MKIFANKHRREAELEEVELVLVKLQPYRQHFVTLRKTHKLGMQYFDHFPIIKMLSPMVYKLQLPEEAKIHNTFHIFLLKNLRPVTTISSHAEGLQNLVR